MSDLMTRLDAMEFARDAALEAGQHNDHAYLPTTEAEAAGWVPHAWVVDAILAATASLSEENKRLRKFVREGLPGPSLRDAVLKLNHLWNTSEDEAEIAAQLDLCRRLAKYTPQADPEIETDAMRFRWLNGDHADPETRAKARELGARLAGIGPGAARADIDSAMAADTKRSMLRTVDVATQKVGAS